MFGGGVFVVCCIAVGVMAGMKKGPFAAPKQPLDEGVKIYTVVQPAVPRKGELPACVRSREMIGAAACWCVYYW